MSPKMEPTLTTREGFAAISKDIRSRVSAIGAMTLVWNVRASAASSNVSSDPPSIMPALLMSMSSAPCSFLIRSTIRWRSSGRVISAGIIKRGAAGARSALVASSASWRRPQSATVIPRCAASRLSARPIPEPAPVMRTSFRSGCITQLRADAQVLKDRTVQAVKDFGVIDDDALGGWVSETIDKRAEESDVVGIERPVRAKVGEAGVALQAERFFHRVSELIRQKHRYSLENMHAAQESIGAQMFD